MIENHQKSPNKILCIPVPVNLPEKSSALAKLSEGPFCILVLIIASNSKYKAYWNYVLFSAIWGLKLVALFGHINLLPSSLSSGRLKNVSDPPTNLYSIV